MSAKRPATHRPTHPVPKPNPDARPAVPGEVVPVDCEDPTVPCRLGVPPATPKPAASAKPIPAVTLTDLVAFRPTPSTLRSEPDRVAVVGLAMNLYTTAPPQTLHGELFDHGVTVRFEPDHFRWTYGDGTSTTTATPGSSWARAGDAQFTQTGTGHVYLTRGTYTAQVTISYTPTVVFDTGLTQTVPGFVTSASAPQRIRVFEAKTALVAHTCDEDPSGPGC